MTAAQRPIKVAVIGGGCAAMTTAFELSRPQHRGRYEVTVYQQGWRLGGKGASGRGAAGRIEEHGLHLWMGWYENAFRLMRACYEELDRDPSSSPIATWRDAFEPDDHLGVVERVADGEWLHWTAHLPAAPGLPGDPYPVGHRWSVAHYLSRSAALVRTLLSTLDARAGRRDGAAPSEDVEGSDADPIARWISRLSTYGGLSSLALLAQAASVLESGLRRLSPLSENGLQRLVEAIAMNAREQIDELVERDPQAGRLFTILDLTLATMRGIIRFGLLDDERGFDAIDDYDCREWLLLNGASRRAVESAFVKGLYDLGFSYEDGDPERPRIAAGQSLRATIRAFFTYRRSFFWRMQAGMGDVVFAPLYEVLKRRGVRFEFFHRLENVGLSRSAEPGEASPHVTSLEFDVQARVRGGGEYRPLVDLRGLPCWPSHPDWRQLENGDWLEREGRSFESFWEPPGRDQRTLRVGEDFDLVVLGVGIGAIPHVCRELVERDPKWRSAVEHGKSVATQAFQVWMHPTMEELGWSGGAVSLSGFVEPFDTWADMRHLIPVEGWDRRPGSLAYFCSVLPEPGAVGDRGSRVQPAQQADTVRRNAIRFLNRDVRHLWPRASRAGEFRWELLFDPERPDANGSGGRGDKAFDSQFWVANVNPSDRYALSLPGSLVHRLSPLDDDYDNLTVCGDWTACGFNAGCVESAVMSGLLAAHAISLSPPLEEIIGYDHP